MIRKFMVQKRDVHGRKTRDKEEIIQLVPRKNPFAKKYLIEVTVVLEPAVFMKPAVIKKEVFHDDLMSVIAKAQAKYSGKTISYRTVDIRPDWLKKEQEEEQAKKDAAAVDKVPD